MNGQIDTGGEFITYQNDIASGKRPVTSGTIIFNAESDGPVSAPVVVAPGSAILVEAYLQPSSSTVISINKVVLGVSSVASGQACNDRNPQIQSKRRGVAPILFRSPVILGPNSPWQLNVTKNRMIIPLPGVYEFVLSDDADLETLHVEYTEIGADNIILPEGYLAGYV